MFLLSSWIKFSFGYIGVCIMPVCEIYDEKDYLQKNIEMLIE